jgi:hypothetical protein
MYLDNSSSNVAIGLGTTGPTARLVVAGPISSGTGVVQLQGSGAVAGTHTLALGYGGSYAGMAMAESGYVQAELPGVGNVPLRLQPTGGVLFLGRRDGVWTNPYLDVDGVTQSRYALQLIQNVTNVASIPGNITQIMASFEMESKIPIGNDCGCGRFTFKQREGGTWFRALEAQAARFTAATINRTWGLEVGVHNALRGEEKHTSVGIYVASGNPNFIDGQTPTRCNTGILIDGRPGDDGHGWDRFILCRQGSLSTSTTDKFEVDRDGNVTAQGQLNNTGIIRGYASLEIFSTGDFGGTVTAPDFNPVPSSREQKENVEDLPENDALDYLMQLNPVRFDLKTLPGRRFMGFIAEDVPVPLQAEGKTKTYSLTGVVATLTRALKSQQQTVERLDARIAALEQRAGQTP